jgi:DNA polymerase III epsilon subunit-like protein
MDVETGEITTIKKTRGANDRKTCLMLRDRIEQADILVGFNVVDYDMKFLQSRLMRWKERPLKSMLVIDLLKVARKIMPWTEGGPNRSLANVCEFLEIEGKTKISWTSWLQATLGRDKESLSEIEIHCINDVKITAQLLDRLKPHIKTISRS